MKDDGQCENDMYMDMSSLGLPLVEGPLILRSFRRMPKHTCYVLVLTIHQAISINCMQLV